MASATLEFEKWLEQGMASETFQYEMWLEKGCPEDDSVTTLCIEDKFLTSIPGDLPIGQLD